MRYRIQARDADTSKWDFGPLVDGTEEQAITAAQAFRTPENVTFVRIIRVESESDVNGAEIWSEPRDA